MSELALKLIRKEKKERTGKLDLGNCGLTDFPEELFELEWLEKLNLCNEYWFVELADWIESRNNGELNRIYSEKLPETFSCLQQLKTLRLGGDWSENWKLNDCSVLGRIISLSSIVLCHNQISDISILKNLTSLTNLDLSSNQISDISILENLTSLTSLDLSFNQISDISILENLTSLTSLDLSFNQISDISILENLTSLTSLDLSSNQISDILILENLKGLTRLYLSGNQISDYSILENMTSLATLDLSSNQISDISILENLTSLTTLDLSSNEISDISILENLTSLTSLDLRSNQIRDISILENLTSLTSLDLRYNQISDIKRLIPLLQKEVPVNLEEYGGVGILLYKNPIIEPPLEIIKQGRESVLDWFEAKRKKLNEIKIILLGDPKAGKTSLFKRLKYDTFNPNEVQTDGVNIEDIEFGECETFLEQKELHSITGHFWDFGGQEIMNATHQFFLTKRAVYVLVLDARKDANNSSQVRQWVKRIRATGDNSPIIVLANQIDVNQGFGFENERELKLEFPQIKYFLKVSCSTNENIGILRNILAEIIPTAELFNTEIDERWIDIKNILGKETKNDNYLNESSFLNICRNAGLVNKKQQRNAITFLHDLGLVLHFEDLNLAEYYVLDPYWITYGVYQILTSAYAGNMKGKVAMDQLNFIVNEEEDKKEAYNPANYKKIEYSPNERRFLIDILNQFRLCFCMADHSQFIIPDLLDTKEPSEVTEPIRSSTENIQFVYAYEYLPKFVMPNIMVEMNRMITAMWRTGCVLRYDGCGALINSYQDRISIVVNGEYKKKREFMSVIRFVINSINEKLSDKPVTLIPLPCIKAFAEYEELLARESNGIMYYIHDEFKPTKKIFSITELLEGISDYDELRKIAKEILSGIKDIQPRVKDIQSDIKKIDAKLDSHYEYLINLPDNSKIKDSIYEVIQELNDQQTEDITKEIMDWVTIAFVEFDGEMDDKLKDIYNELQKTDDVQAKLKLSIPFINMLGINFETVFDVKSWAEKMYKKYELKLFRLMY